MFQNLDSDPIAFKSDRPSVPGDVVHRYVVGLPGPGSSPRLVPKLPRGGRTRVKLSPSDIREKGLPGYLRWLQRDFPAVHVALAARRPDLLSNDSGLGFTVATSAWPSVAAGAAASGASRGQQIADFVLPLLHVYQQREIMKLQLKRAQLGQPPLDVENLSAPATRIELEAGAKTQRTGMMIAGALGLGAVAYFLTRGRARA